jgi:hypothetical protein
MIGPSRLMKGTTEIYLVLGDIMKSSSDCEIRIEIPFESQPQYHFEDDSERQAFHYGKTKQYDVMINTVCDS